MIPLPGLHSATTVLKAGVHVTVPVTIKNTGTAPESFFVDGRLTSTATLSLAPLTSGAATLPPTTSVPEWLVPTQTDAVHVTACATPRGWDPKLAAHASTTPRQPDPKLAAPTGPGQTETRDPRRSHAARARHVRAAPHRATRCRPGRWLSARRVRQARTRSLPRSRCQRLMPGHTRAPHRSQARCAVCRPAGTRQCCCRS